MKLRLAAIVFLVAVLATGLTSLSFQPVLAGLMEALRRATVQGSAPALVRDRAREALPLLLGLDLVLVGLFAYAVLWLAVSRRSWASSSDWTSSLARAVRAGRCLLVSRRRCAGRPPRSRRSVP